MTRTETTTAKTRTADGPVGASGAPRARCSRSTSCRCGQQLDMCAQDHCPRCGRTLPRR